MQVVRINHTLKYTESQILVVKYFICGSSHHDDDDHTTLTSSGCCSWPFTHYRYEWRTYNLIYWGCGAKIHSQKLGSSGCPAPKSATPRRHLAWRSTWGVFAVKMCWLCFFWTITTGWPKCNHLPIYSELQRMEVTSKSVVNLIVIVLYILWCTHSMCALYVYYIYNHIYVYQICSHIKPYAYKRVEHFERAKLHHFGWSLNKEIMAESRGSLKHVPLCITCQSACVYWSPTGTLAGCVALLKSWMPLKTWTNHLERYPACPGQAVNITKKSSYVCNGQKTGDSLAGLKVIIHYIAQLGFVEASLTSSCPSLP